MGFGAGDIVEMIWSHPIATVMVALLFTPPLFPIVVFFSPLLISTALVVLAMVSMGSNGEESSSTAGGYAHSHYKRDWLEQEATAQMLFDEDDGPVLLDEEKRLSKRRKGGPIQEDGWLEKVRNWEETGRAWVDSVLHQEGWRGNSISSTEPMPAAATREVVQPRFAQPIPQPLPRPPPPEKSTAAPIDSATDVQKPDATDGQPRSDGIRPTNEISSAPEELNAVPPHSNRGYPLPEPASISDDRDKDKYDDSRPKTKWDEELPASDASKVTNEQLIEGIQIASSAVPKEDVVATAVENTGSHEKSGNAQSFLTKAADRTDPNSVSAQGSTSSVGEGKVSEKAMRERRGEHHRTPSVAVALSEKLNVPLEDLMSLLAGEDKPPSSSGAANPDGSSSSETGNAREENWSKADGEEKEVAAQNEEIQPADKSD